MTETVLTVAITSLAGIITATGSALIGLRRGRQDGSRNNSAILLAEREAIAEERREIIDRQQAEIERLAAKVAELESKLNLLSGAQIEGVSLRRENSRLQKEVDVLRAENASLRIEVENLRQRVEHGEHVIAGMRKALSDGGV